MTATVRFNLDADVLATLKQSARSEGLTDDAMLEKLIRERLAGSNPPLAMQGQDAVSRLWPDLPPPIDEWHAGLRSIAVDCGVSLTDEQLSSESLYD